MSELAKTDSFRHVFRTCITALQWTSCRLVKKQPAMTKNTVYVSRDIIPVDETNYSCFKNNIYVPQGSSVYANDGARGEQGRAQFFSGPRRLCEII